MWELQQLLRWCRGERKLATHVVFLFLTMLVHATFRSQRKERSLREKEEGARVESVYDY
jgi:hypothetical protein